MKVIFTRHALKKFRDLAKAGVIISRKDVFAVIDNPEHLDKESGPPKVIASRAIDVKHILRVVLREESGIITVITFYPARKGRYYENQTAS